MIEVQDHPETYCRRSAGLARRCITAWRLL
jgi:hypothetical protein